MKFLLKFIALAFFALSMKAQSKLNRNKDNNYYGYTIESFKKLNRVNQKIDVNHVDYALLNAAIFYRTNEERIKFKKKEFIHSDALEQAAFDHSKDMVEKSFFSHTSPITEKTTMMKRLKKVGIEHTACAENIYDYNEIAPTYWSLADNLIIGWMNSPGHKENIMDDLFLFLGCGAVDYKNPEFAEYFFVKSTQNFSESNNQQ